MNFPRSLLAVAAFAATIPAYGQLVISQVYGGGGNTSATYRNDYVEVFNRGASAQTLAGLSVQYASASGTGNFQVIATLSGTLQPGQYYLVQAASGGAVGAILPGPDATGSLNMSATAGKVILANSTTGLACNGGSAPCTDAQLALILDLVGYGAANFFEGSGPAPGPSSNNQQAALRSSGGCVDTNVNSADFTAGAPNPRYTASATNPCSGAGNPSGTGTANPASVTAGSSTTLSATITLGTPPAPVSTVTCDLTAIGGSATFALSGSGTSFSAGYLVPAATPLQAYALPCTVTDTSARTGTFNIALTVISSSTPPAATGSASPASLAAGNATTLSATVTAGSNPTSTGLAVSCNLSAIGGSATFSLPSPGFSTSYTVPLGTAAAAYALPCTVSDAQARSSSFNIALTVTSTPPAPRRIYEITGSGTASPLAGQAVTVTAVVTALRAATTSGKGFYLESLPADRDADPNTSEGILVFIGSGTMPACAVTGNLISMDATVSDFIPAGEPAGSVPLTELGGVSNCQVLATGMLGNLPAAVTIDNSNPLVVGGSATQARKWLGMRVNMPNAVVVGASLGTLNEVTAQSTPAGEFFVTLPGVARPQHGPGILATRRPNDAPGSIPTWNGNPEVMRVATTQLAAAGTPYEVAVGTTITGISGVMEFNTTDGDYEIFTNASGAGTPNPLTPTRSATPVPAALPADLTIGAFNIERFYNDTAEGNGATTISTAAYQGRLNKLSLAIRNVMLMPDILGLEEVEGQKNTQGAADPHVIDAIVAKVNADAVAAGQGNPNYAWCVGVTNDASGITPAIMYKQGKVQIGECVMYGAATHYNEPDGGNNFLNDRPPVTIKATVKAPGSDSGIPLRVVVNHLRSLSGIDTPGAGNGDQVRTKRNQQAKYLASLINGTSGEQSTNWNTADNLVVVGDFNAYHVNDGYADVMNCIVGNPPAANTQYFTAAQLAVDSPCTPILNPALVLLTTLNPAAYYSYVFSGSIQTLDHVLLNTKITPRFRQLAYARNDAEFPEGPAYRNDFSRPERVSDHDMPVLYLKLPMEVTSRTSATATTPALDRTTGRYNVSIRVTNTGAAPIAGPIYVFFNNLTPGVTMPGLPTFNGVPYATITLPAPLAPGATAWPIVASFAAPSAAFSYTMTRFDGVF